MMTSANSHPICRVFVSYSHDDDDFRQQLDSHLNLLERQGYIEIWSDRRIQPGANWEEELDDRLLSADLILLLISASFIAKTFVYKDGEDAAGAVGGP